MIINSATKISNYHVKRHLINKDDVELVIYGLVLGGKLLINICTTVALGVVFDLVLESVVFLISFLLIRVYAGGYHSKNSISCYFFSTMAILIALFIIKLTPDEHMLFISMVMLTIALPVYIVIAPVDTDGKGFDYNGKKYYRKRMIRN